MVNKTTEIKIGEAEKIKRFLVDKIGEEELSWAIKYRPGLFTERKEEDGMLPKNLKEAKEMFFKPQMELINSSKENFFFTMQDLICIVSKKDKWVHSYTKGISKRSLLEISELIGLSVSYTDTNSQILGEIIKEIS